MNSYLNKDWLYSERVIKGRSLKDIADQFGVSKEAVSRMARLWGFRELYNKRHKPYMNKEWLEEEYVTNRRKESDIAEECGVSAGTIGKWVKIHRLHRQSLTREQVNARHRKRYHNDPRYRAKRAKISKEWREKNLEKCRAKSREYYNAHRK